MENLADKSANLRNVLNEDRVSDSNLQDTDIHPDWPTTSSLYTPMQHHTSTSFFEANISNFSIGGGPNPKGSEGGVL